MIDFNIFKDKIKFNHSDFLPKPTTLSSNQKEALKELWTSEDGRTKIGIWECTEGTFTADRSKIAEYCHIFSGEAEIISDNGSSRRLVAGDILVLPLGWKGKWIIKERVRKLYILSLH